MSLRLSHFLLSLTLLFNSASAEETSDLWSLYLEASTQDPALQREMSQLNASQEYEKEARGRLLPQVALSNVHSRSRLSYDQSDRVLYNGSTLGVSLRQPIYDPGIWRSYQRLRELTAHQQLSVDEARKQTALQIAERYFTVLAAEDELELTKAELLTTQRNQQRIDAMLKRQMAILPDLLEAEARVATLQASLLEAENAVHTARDALAERIGRPILEPLMRLHDNPDFSPLQRQEADWIAVALQRNLALRSQEHALAAAEHAVREAKAASLPQVSLNLSAQRSDLGYEGNPSPESTNLIASVAIQVPLYAGGSIRARSAALHAEKEAAGFDYERIRREVIKETRAAQLVVETSPARIRAALQAQQAAVKSRQAAERAFELGIFNAVEVLERVRDEYQARRDLLRSRYTYVTQLLLLYHWSGILEESDIRSANSLLVSTLPAHQH